MSGCLSWSPASLGAPSPVRRSPVGGRDRCLVVVGSAVDRSVVRTARAGICPLGVVRNRLGLAGGLGLAFVCALVAGLGAGLVAGVGAGLVGGLPGLQLGDQRRPH